MNQLSLTKKLIIASFFDKKAGNNAFLPSVDLDCLNTNTYKNNIIGELNVFYTQILVNAIDTGEKFTENTYSATLINSYLKNYEKKHLMSMVSDECRRYKIANEITLFTAIRLNSKKRASVRKSYYKGYLVMFEVDSSLLGGIQILQNTTMDDFSWKSKIANSFSNG